MKTSQLLAGLLMSDACAVARQAAYKGNPLYFCKDKASQKTAPAPATIQGCLAHCQGLTPSEA